MFLFSKQHEELIGIYASQLARHRCIDLFVHMMELRLSSRYFFFDANEFVSSRSCFFLQLLHLFSSGLYPQVAVVT